MTPSIITRIGKAATRFAELRLKWVQALFWFTLGWLSCVAWVFTLHYAPEIAVELIEVLASLSQRELAA